MRRLKSYLVASLAVGTILSTVQSYADSPVWRISKGSDELFLGGTIHVLSEQDYPLPAAFDKAYHQADTLVGEADIQGMLAPKTQMLMMSRLTYHEPEGLKSELSPETFQKLTLHLESRGIPLFTIMMFKPGMASSMLVMLELQRLGLAGVGVDEFFSRKAISDAKVQSQLETIEEQISFLEKMGEGQADQLINYTLQEIEDLLTLMQGIRSAWRRGDRRALIDMGITPFKKDTPAAYQQLIVKRNNNWLPKIEAMLMTPEVEMVLVGALHLVGEDGLLQRLQQKGYRIEAL